MRSKFLFLFLVPILFYSCNNQNECSEEKVATDLKAFEAAYLNWKASLNFMDQDVIAPAQKTLESSYKNLITCKPIDENFKPFVDSISFTFSNQNINRNSIELAGKLVLTLDKKMESLN